MRNIWTIAMRDFRTYFTSPIAYIVIFSFLLIMGWMYVFNLFYSANQSMQFQQMGRGPSLTDGLIRPLYGNMNVVLLFLMPFITMRLFAEERKQHTIELLLTSPVTLTEIILGKYLAGVLLVLVMLGLTLVYPATLAWSADPDWGPVIASYLGTLLLAGCYLATGVLFSAVTENQIVAGSLTFAAGLFFWLISWASQSAGPVWSDVLNYLSLVGHFTNSFGVGVISTSDTFYYLSFIGIWLFLTHRVLDSYRWR
jgi:ABC-2 type transport system permease protein